MDKQYDISHKMQELFAEKQKRRAAAKEYYLKLLYNPHRPIGDGVPFDPALQRFTAMSAYHYEYIKPTGATYFKYFLFVSPVFLLTYFLSSWRKKREELFRSGVISYENRSFKNLY